jgi:hypothetical protein
VSGATLSIRRGAGVAGSDRLTLIWPDGLITNCWLEVTVKSTAYTGLASDFVFYFGNAVGETGDSLSHARVGTADMIGVRQNPRNQLNPAAIDNPYDFNRDRRVSAIDEALVRLNATSALTALRLIAPPPLVSAPQGDESALRPRARRRA